MRSCRPDEVPRIAVTRSSVAVLLGPLFGITVSSAVEAIVKPEHIKRGAVVCDVARPRDVSVAVAKVPNVDLPD